MPQSPFSDNARTAAPADTASTPATAADRRIGKSSAKVIARSPAAGAMANFDRRMVEGYAPASTRRETMQIDAPNYVVVVEAAQQGGGREPARR